MKKSLFKIMFGICLLFIFMPSAMAGTEINFSEETGITTVREDKTGDCWEYDYDEGVLTIDNCASLPGIFAVGYDDPETDTMENILTIDVNGINNILGGSIITNSKLIIKSETAGVLNISGGDYGVFSQSEGGLTITGSVTVNISNTKVYYDMVARGDDIVLENGARVNINAGSVRSVGIYKSYNDRVGNLIIDNASLKVTYMGEPIQSCQAIAAIAIESGNENALTTNKTINRVLNEYPYPSENRTQYNGPDLACSSGSILIDIEAIQYNITVDSAIANGNLAPQTTAGENEWVNVNPNPSTGYQIKPGSLEVTTASETDVAVRGNYFKMPAEAVTVSAQFEIANPITISPVTNGKVTAKSTAAPGEVVAITITPNVDYRLKASTFKVLDSENNPITVSQTNTFVMPNSAVTINAEFEKLYNIGFLWAVENGTVDVVTKAAAGDVVTLDVTPNNGYQHTRTYVYGGDGEIATTNSYTTFTMPASDVSLSVYITEVIVYYDIIKDSGMTNGTINTPSSSYPEGSAVYLNINPDEGYAYDSGTLTATNASGNDITITNNYFIMPASDVTISADFVRTYDIILEEDQLYYVFSNDDLIAGETIELELEIAPGYRYVEGSLKVMYNSSELTITNNTITMPAGDISVTAEVEEIILDAPTITAISNNYNQIKISSELSNEAHGYEIYYSTSKTGRYTMVADPDSEEYIHNGLTTGKTYYYKVRQYVYKYDLATDDFILAYSPYSTIVSTAPKLKTTTTTFVSATYNSAKISWTKVDGAKYYQVYRATSLNGTYSRVATTTSLSYTNKYLTTGRTYYYKVRAYRVVSRSNKYSSFSNIVSTGTLKVGIPNVSIWSTGYNSIKLSYNKISGASRYAIYRSTDNINWTRLGSTTKTSYTNSGLTTGKTYYYKVRAYRTVSRSNKYGDNSAVKEIIPVPSKPSYSVSSAGYDKLKISIAKVSGATGYEIYKENEPDQYELLTDIRTTSYIDTNLTTGTYYKYKVRAYRVVNEEKVYGGFGANVSNKPIPSTPTAKASSYNYTTIKLTISEVSGATKYAIYRATSKSGTYTKIGETTDLTYLNTVTFNKTYYYKVRAITTVNENDIYSNYSSYTYTKTVVSKPIVTVASNSYNSIKISYEPVAGATGYKIYRATSKNGYYRLIKTTSATEYINGSLSFNKGYYYKVRAYRKVGRSYYYSSYSSKMYAKTALTKPIVTGFEFLTGIQVNYTSVLGATKYEIYRSADNVNFEKILTTTALSKMEENLEYGTYYYKVRAIRVVSRKNYYGPYSEVFQQSYVDYSGSGGGIE